MTGITVDVEGNLLLQNGSLSIDDNKAQIVQHVVVCGKGELKHAPLLGCNLRSMIAGPVDPFFKSEAKRQIELQGITVNSIKIQGANINIDYV